MKLSQWTTDEANGLVEFSVAGKALNLDYPASLDLYPRGTGGPDGIHLFTATGKALRALLKPHLGPKPLRLNCLNLHVRMPRDQTPKQVEKRGLGMDFIIGARGTHSQAQFRQDSALPYLMKGEAFSDLNHNRWRMRENGFVFVENYRRLYGHDRVDLRVNPRMVERLTN